MSAIVERGRDELIRTLQHERDTLRSERDAARKAHESAEQDVRRLQAECERSVEQLNRERTRRLQAEQSAIESATRAEAAEHAQSTGAIVQALQLLAEAKQLVDTLCAASLPTRQCQATVPLGPTQFQRCTLLEGHVGPHNDRGAAWL